MTKLIEFKNKEGDTLRGLYKSAHGGTGVVFIHGFERTVVEPKFKNISDRLTGSVSVFAFDFSGAGLSDGKFNDITAEKCVDELSRAIKTLKRQNKGIKRVVLVAHSFACCVALQYITSIKNDVEKVVFLAPAFNQKALQRYWFAQSHAKHGKRTKIVTWKNYAEHFTEKDFQEFVRIPKRQTKSNYISNKYFLENADADYQELFSSCKLSPKQIMIIHGGKDRKVPKESNGNIPEGVKLIIVKDGDHDLERANVVPQYINKVVRFISDV